MSRKKVYIYTIPKAGTYLLAEIVSRLGFENTGLHVGLDHYLDTGMASLEEAARRPSDTTVHQPYLRTLRAIPPGALCFGHLSPMLFPPPLSEHYVVIGCRRDLRSVLAAEFIDFRFRRTDLAWISSDAIPDHKAAFAEYLRRNGPAIAAISGAYIANREVRGAWYFNSTRRLGNYMDIAFEALWETPRCVMKAIAETVGTVLPERELMARFEAAVGAENKTKSVKETFPVSRDELWTPEAEEVYRELRFPELSALLGYAPR